MICPYCGAANLDAALWCGQCGSRLDPRAPGQRGYPQPASLTPQEMPKTEPAPTWQETPPIYFPSDDQLQGYIHPQAAAGKPESSSAAPQAGTSRLHIPALLKRLDPRTLWQKHPRQVIIAGGVLLAMILVILVVSLIPGGSPVQLSSTLHMLDRFTQPDETAVFHRAVLLDETEGTLNSLKRSLDGSVTVFVTQEQELYLVYKEEVSPIAEDVSWYTLSSNGRTLAYIDEAQNGYIYDIPSRQEEKLAKRMVLIALSPDGKTVAYTTGRNSLDVEDMEVFLYDGKESRSLTDGMGALGLTNGGKQIYCVDEDDSLVLVDAKGEEEKIASDLSNNGLVFNRDHSQLLFQSGDKWYIWNGHAKIKLSGKDSNTRLITARWQASASDDIAPTLGTDTFSNSFYQSGSTLYYLNGKFESEKISSYAYGVLLSADGQTVYYVDEDDTLYMVKAGKPDQETEVAEEVYSYAITPDGKAIYYIDQDDNLWYCKGSKDPKRIDSDVLHLFITHDGYALYLVDYRNSSGELYASRNGSKGQELMDDVYYVLPYPDATYVFTDYDMSDNSYDVLGAAKGTDFDSID